jgi:hypothetical protein
LLIENFAQAIAVKTVKSGDPTIVYGIHFASLRLQENRAATFQLTCMVGHFSFERLRHRPQPPIQRFVLSHAWKVGTTFVLGQKAYDFATNKADSVLLQLLIAISALARVVLSH